MNAIPAPVAGVITVALIVGLGIFVYPWLLTQRHGRWIVGSITLLVATLFMLFEGSESSSYSRALAAGWALGPVIAGLVVSRISRKDQ